MFSLQQSTSYQIESWFYLGESAGSLFMTKSVSLLILGSDVCVYVYVCIFIHTHTQYI